MSRFHTSSAYLGETEKASCFLLIEFLFVSPFWDDFEQELFCKGCHAFVLSRIKGENRDGADFKMGVGTRCSEHSEWTSLAFNSVF